MKRKLTKLLKAILNGFGVSTVEEEKAKSNICKAVFIFSQICGIIGCTGYVIEHKHSFQDIILWLAFLSAFFSFVANYFTFSTKSKEMNLLLSAMNENIFTYKDEMEITTNYKNWISKEENMIFFSLFMLCCLFIDTCVMFLLCLLRLILIGEAPQIFPMAALSNSVAVNFILQIFIVWVTSFSVYLTLIFPLVTVFEFIRQRERLCHALETVVNRSRVEFEVRFPPPNEKRAKLRVKQSGQRCVAGSESAAPFSGSGKMVGGLASPLSGTQVDRLARSLEQPVTGSTSEQQFDSVSPPEQACSIMKTVDGSIRQLPINQANGSFCSGPNLVSPGIPHHSCTNSKKVNGAVSQQETDSGNKESSLMGPNLASPLIHQPPCTSTKIPSGCIFQHSIKDDQDSTPKARLRNCELRSEYRKILKRNIVQCIRHHQQLRKTFLIFDTWFGNVFAFQLFSCVFFCALTLRMLFMATVSIQYKVSMCCGSLLLMTESFVWSYIGNQFLELNERIADTIFYQIEWYEQAMEVRRLLIIFHSLVRAKPFALFGFTVIETSYRTFSAMCRQIYSYFNVLKSIL